MNTRDMAGRPGCLKIESAGHRIDIQYFAGKIQAWKQSALHRFKIHFFQIYATCRDKFIFIRAFTIGTKDTGCQQLRQFTNIFFG